MEYDMDIKPTKLVKGQGLAKLLVDSSCQALGLHLMVEQPVQEELQAEQEKENIMEQYVESTWYADIVHFLLYLQCPEYLDKNVDEIVIDANMDWTCSGPTRCH